MRADAVTDDARRRLRVVIADDDPRVLEDVARILADADDIDVVASAADGASAVEVCERVDPDVVIMDVRMPRVNGIEATRTLQASAATSCRVLVITTFDLDDYVFEAIRAGASGFLLKDRAPELLAAAVRTVAAGDAIVAHRATTRLIAELARPAPPRTSHPLLTDREVEVVALLAQGMSNDDIAERAFIARATVKTHVSSILAKLGLTSRIQVVVWAYEHGIARPPRTGRDERRAT